MKTAKEIAVEINNETGEMFADFDFLTVEEILLEWERGIREDQDKITRHKAADNLLYLDYKLDTDGCNTVIDLDDAHSTVLNTKAI